MAVEYALPILSVGIVTVLFIAFVKRQIPAAVKGASPSPSSNPPEEEDAAQRSFNEVSCYRCCRTFDSFKDDLPKKLLCHRCRFNVCRVCADFDSERRCWTCKYCDRREPFRYGNPHPQLIYKNLKRRYRQFQTAKSYSINRSASVVPGRNNSDSENDDDSGYVPSLSASWDCALPSQRKGERDLTAENLVIDEETLDESSLEIREHIESIVERFLNDTLDSSPLDTLYTHSEYERLFLLLHGRLRETLAQLSHSLQKAINKEPLSAEDNPSTVHSTLQLLIKEANDEAMGLPIMEEHDICSTPVSTNDEDSIQNQSYESILSTAILNKVVERYQRAHNSEFTMNDNFEVINNNNGHHYPIFHAFDKEIQTDVEEELLPLDKSYTPLRDYDSFDGSSSLGTESADNDFSWAVGTGLRRIPVQMRIEEHIEEVTTVEEVDGGGTIRLVKEPQVTRNVVEMQQKALPEMDFLCPGLEFSGATQRVPFPELGLDVVASDYPTPEVGSEAINYGMLVSKVEEWEDNWLFKKKKRASPFRNLGNLDLAEDDPIAMHVPNPQDDVKIKVGEREIDELSDMSECHSAQSLEDFTSDSEMDAELTTESLTESLVVPFSDSFDDERTVKKIPLVELLDNLSAAVETCNSAIVPEYQVEKNSAVSQENNKKERTPVPSPRLQRKTFAPLDMEKPKQQQPEKGKGENNNEKQLAVPTATSAASSFTKPVFIPASSRKPSELCVISLDLPPQSIPVVVGKPARFKCVVKSPKPYQVAWFFGCELLESEGKYDIFEIGNEHYLEIYGTDEQDGGTYSCLAYSKDNDEQVWSEFKLTVKGVLKSFSPPSIVRPLEEVTAVVGSDATFSWSVNGIPEPRVTWYKNQERIFPGKLTVLESKPLGEYILKLHSVSGDSEGDYSVVAENKIGRVSCEAYLTVSTRHEKSKKVEKLQNQEIVKRPNKLTIPEAEDTTVVDSSYLDKDRDLTEESLYNVNSLPEDSIAAREHRKWQNPVPMKNNPYSSENISRRLERSLSQISLPSSPTLVQKIATEEDGLPVVEDGVNENLFRYHRDYYVLNSTRKLSDVHNPTTKTVDPVSNDIAPLENNKPQKSLETIQPQKLEEEATSSSNQKNNALVTENELEMLMQEAVRLNDVRLKNKSNREKIDYKPSSSTNGTKTSNLSKDSKVTQNGDSSKTNGGFSSPSVLELAKRFSSASVETSPVLSRNNSITSVSSFKLEEKANIHQSISENAPLSVEPSGSPRVSKSNKTNAISNGLHSEVFSWASLHPSHDASLSCSLSSSNELLDEIPKSSVKQLTLKFLQDHMSDGKQNFFVKRASESTFEVHSLTARSLSREFREATKKNLPKPTIRNISSMQSSDSDGDQRPSNTASANTEDIHGYTSDESNASSVTYNNATNPKSGSDNQPVPKPRKRMTKSILSRASFWNRRVEEGLNSDRICKEEFPDMMDDSTSIDSVTHL